ncbi:unnamed protein product [Anisakis simplex]|uniref:DUF659 domain-containing protein n=1 Tax=Anisakis simplex TaxID=6269 RepID=A0A0M3JYR6_ANISI|nr:unnamed protein product [Anisakis simplex]
MPRSSSDRRSSGSRRRSGKRDPVNERDVRFKNFARRVLEGVPGHPESRMVEDDLQYGSRGKVYCSNLLQVLGVLSMMPNYLELVRWVDEGWPLTIAQLPPELGGHSILCRFRIIRRRNGTLASPSASRHIIERIISEVNEIHFMKKSVLMKKYLHDVTNIAMLDRRGPNPSPGPQEERPAEPLPQPEEPFMGIFYGGEEDEEELTDNDANQPQPNDNTNDETNPTQAEEGPAQPRYFLRRPQTPRQPKQQREPQVFRPHNIEHLRPEHQAELAAPDTEAYHVDNNMIWCRLAGCARPDQPFKTVRAWKIHVQRAACHRRQTLCTACGHNVVLPPSAHLSAAEIKVIMDAHRSERCVGVSKKALETRKTAAERLMILGRDNSHIAVPDEDAEEVQVPSNPRKRHLASEAAWRADQCCQYLKRFKDDHPDLMEQIGMEHQLRFD